MLTTRTLTALALVMGLGMAPALAQDEVALDTDQNDEVSGEEWSVFGDNTFGDADADDSGYLDENEYNDYAQTNWGGEPGGGDDDGPLWGLFDVNDDSQVTEDEWFAEDSFTSLDDDESGILDGTEIGL